MWNYKGFVIKDKTIYEYNEDAEVVNIPAGVKWVGWGAFREKNMKVVNCPESLIGIDTFGFSGCSALEEINFSLNIKIIGPGAFEFCKSLVSIKIPPKVKSIKRGTFQYCKKLREVLLPEGLESIHAESFYGCSALEYLFVPDSVSKIQKSVFGRCDALKELSIPSTIEDKDFLWGYLMRSIVVFRDNPSSWDDF